MVNDNLKISRICVCVCIPILYYIFFNILPRIISNWLKSNNNLEDIFNRFSESGL